MQWLEAGNTVFSWEWHNGEIKCAHENHADLQEGWIFEPCEHCGAEITGADYYPPATETFLESFMIRDVPVSAGTYIFHPCGHTMRQFTAWKEET